MSDAEINALCVSFEEIYNVADALKKGRTACLIKRISTYQNRFAQVLQQGNYKGFTDTFEDPAWHDTVAGMAVQRLMAEGYGFGGEGDWKTAALVRAMKVMGSGLSGGNSFMEDYTYHFEPGNEMVLGAHMLEICEASPMVKASCEIHPLGIGGKTDPVRLVFNVAGGAALNASVVDMGNRFRLW